MHDQKDSKRELDRSVTDVLNAAEASLRGLVNDEFLERNDRLRKRYSDQDVLEVFRFCLMRPGGHHWSPIWQVLLILFQAAFSESYKTAERHFGKVGNYIIHRLPKGSRPIIYSFGIGNDISFDEEAAALFDVPVFMYDPTPAVAGFMADHAGNDRLVFRGEGIFSREDELKFYTSDEKLNASLYPIHNSDQHEVVRCRPLSAFVEENGHDRIDLLKMDIEGVADDVLNQILDETTIRPRQIVTEFEIKGIENPLTYLPKILEVARKLQAAGYLIFNQQLTRKATIELIIVHRSLFDELDAAGGNDYLP